MGEARNILKTHVKVEITFCLPNFFVQPWTGQDMHTCAAWVYDQSRNCKQPQTVKSVYILRAKELSGILSCLLFTKCASFNDQEAEFGNLIWAAHKSAGLPLIQKNNITWALHMRACMHAECITKHNYTHRPCTS